jgi:hypothetical protein
MENMVLNDYDDSLCDITAKINVLEAGIMVMINKVQSDMINVRIVEENARIERLRHAHKRFRSDREIKLSA